MTLSKYLSIAALVAALSLASGCNNKPPEGTKSAVVYDSAATPAAPAASTPAPAAMPSPAPTTPAPAVATPAPAAAPATPPAATPQPPAEAQPAAVPTGAVTYVIEPNDDSDISFTGYKVTGHKQGGFANFSGTVEVPGGDITQAKIDVTADLASVFSEAGALTEKLKSPDFFDVGTHPKATFTSTGIEKTADGCMVKGDFNLHGVVKPIGFPAKISVEGDTLTASAEFTIDRNIWNVSYAGVTDDLIKPEVLISFNIVANKR